ncbi:MAG: DUF4330 domain-containing protein [Tissierellia bacterium]|nr:DUF4330 domain-containing protein [Tissierellia bacterium]
MKIIDNKGKLFGIINVVDLVVILLVALVLYGGFTRLKKSPTAEAESKKALVTLEISDVRNATVDGIQVGDPLYHYDKGTFFGTIVDKKVEPYKEPVESGDGRWVLAEVPGKYVVTLTVEAEAKDTEDVVIIGGEHTRIGTQFKLKNKKIAVFTTILGVEVK